MFCHLYGSDMDGENMLLSSLISGFMTGAGLIIAIGAQNAFVLKQGILRNHIGIVVLTSAIADIVLIICGIAGIGALVKELPILMNIFRFGGAAFLGYYGFLAAQRAWQGSGGLSITESSMMGRSQVFLTCLAFTLLNPHVYLDTMVLIGSISTRYEGSAQAMFGLGACIASIVWFTSLGYGARLLRPIFTKPNAWRILDAIIAIFMFVLCLLLIFKPLN